MVRNSLVDIQLLSLKHFEVEEGTSFLNKKVDTRDIKRMYRLSVDVKLYTPCFENKVTRE